MAQPTSAPTSRPDHPACTMAPLLLVLVLVALAVLVEDLEDEEALLVVVAAAVEPPEEGAEVAPARGAVDWPAI